MHKDSILDLSQYMACWEKYQKDMWSRDVLNSCLECGDTGIEAQHCCDGSECGCHGLHVDYQMCCDTCGRFLTSEEISSVEKAWMKKQGEDEWGWKVKEFNESKIP